MDIPWTKEQLMKANLKLRDREAALKQEVEQLDRIKKLSQAEDITLADFAKEVLKIIEGRETPTREARV